MKMSNSIPSLLIEGLAFAYPDGHQALFGVNLKVSQGECVAILGPNGAGKTTLVLHLNGIHPTTVGKVWIAGTLVDAKDKESLSKIRAKVGIVFQDPGDQLFMPTVGEDVAFGPYNMGLRGAELDDVVDTALKQVGMLEFKGRAPHHLSFGQRRRVAVATVLAMKPEILVLDEPSSNLDPASRRELADILRELKMRGISSYNLKKAAAVFEEEPYLDIFNQLAKRKITAVQGLPLEAQKKKVFEYLRYRGWSTGLIYEKLNAMN